MQQESHSRALTRADASTAVAVAPSAGVAVSRGEQAASALAARAKAEVEARALVAMHRPRSIGQFRARLLEACERSRFAEVARYAKPVGNGKVEGWSIRFAEEVARHYGNLDIAAVMTVDDEAIRVFDVSATDLEANVVARMSVAVEKIVERSKVKLGDEVIGKRQNSQGHTTYILRATDDALLNKQAALISKARRQLILQLVPSDILEEAHDVVRSTLQAEERQDPTARRKRMLDAFADLGVDAADIGAYLGKDPATLNATEVRYMAAIYTAIREGDTTWAEAVAQQAKASGNAADTTAEGAPARASAQKRGAAAKLEAIATASPTAPAAPTTAADAPAVAPAPGQIAKALTDEAVRAEYRSLESRKVAGESLSPSELKRMSEIRRDYPEVWADEAGSA